ncbi:NAD(P)H-dependent oxidoreductase [Pantoea sp. Ap-967]|uniref:NAD(P)H-dependent oxidoreductase n=1 Tax=Pantoea sp. Ap-967 TaxID=2608362 RepID=UPI00141DBC0B|nr:NAD(P)H-dependent oxidoreductase [Pantoea sp. Ap-967]
MAKTLVVVAHPDLSSSRINAAWYNALQGQPGVTVVDLYGRYPDGRIDIAAEQQLIEAHERIVLQFPMQWYNCPALLKQWIDDVFADGWAYGSGKAVAGKTLSIAVSTWSKASDYQTQGRYGRTLEELTSPFEVLAFRIDMHYRPGYFLSGIGDIGDDALRDNAEQYRHYITAFEYQYSVDMA